MPASSIARADATISSSGSMVSCITPIRNGGGIDGSLILGRGGRALGLRLVRLRREWVHALVGAAGAGVGLRLRIAVGRLAVVVHVARLGRRGIGARLLGAGRSTPRARAVAGLARRARSGFLHLLVKRGEHLLHLLVDDR